MVDGSPPAIHQVINVSFTLGGFSRLVGQHNQGQLNQWICGKYSLLSFNHAVLHTRNHQYSTFRHLTTFG